MSFHYGQLAWMISRERWQGLLSVLLIFAATQVKNEGLFWSLSVLVGLIVYVFPLRWSLGILVGAVVSAVLLISLFPQEQEVAGHTLAQLSIGFRGEAFWPLVKSLVWLESWHLLFCN